VTALEKQIPIQTKPP